MGSNEWTWVLVLVARPEDSVNRFGIGTQAQQGVHIDVLYEENSREHVYKVMELVGSSSTSIVEVQHVRGHIENGRTVHFQVTLRVGSPSRKAEILR